MKILHVITGLENGGAEGALFRLVKFSSHLQHCVISLTGEGVYAKRLRAIGVPVFAINLRGFWAGLCGIFSIRRILKAWKPDVVQTWMYHSDLIGGIVAKCTGFRSIVWGIRHSTLRKRESKKRTRIIAFLCAKLSYFIPAKIITCSHIAAEWHALFGYKKNLIKVVPNGFDVNTFKPAIKLSQDPSLKNSTITTDTFVVGMLARWHPDKSHQTALRAFAILRGLAERIELHLAGPCIDGSNRELLSMIEKYDLTNQVHLLGSQDDVQKFMVGIDLHILTSRTEAFPNVVAEAMLCGTPCVATDVGDVRRIVGEYGWLVEPGDHVDIASCIIQALQEKKSIFSGGNEWQIRKIKGRNKIVQDYSISKMVEGFEQVWAESLR